MTLALADLSIHAREAFAAATRALQLAPMRPLAAERAVVSGIYDLAPGWEVAAPAWAAACSSWWAIARAGQRVARAEVRRRSVARLTRGDLLAEAELGLYRAAQRWDPSRGVPFELFAGAHVRRQLGRAVARAHLVVGASDQALEVDGLVEQVVDPIDPQRIAEVLEAIELLTDDRHRRILRGLAAGHTHDELALELGIRRSRFFELRVDAVDELARSLR